MLNLNTIKQTTLLELKLQHHVRLNEIIEFCGSVSNLAYHIGVSPQAVGQWLRLNKMSSKAARTLPNAKHFKDTKFTTYYLRPELSMCEFDHNE